jgi:VanZ family protein
MHSLVAKHRKLWRFQFGALLLLVAVAALLPAGSEPLFPGIDKIEHCLAYSVLFVSGWLAFPGTGWHWRLYTGLLVYGATIEILQSLTGYRFMEFADLVANVLGMGLGNLFIGLCRRAGWLTPAGEAPAPGAGTPGIAVNPAPSGSPEAWR